MSHPVFLRDAALPWLELRSATDSAACYREHTHDTWSVGLIDAGHSTLSVAGTCRPLCAGQWVCIPPAQVHACNPAPGLCWGYRMFYFDAGWVEHALEPWTAMQPPMFAAVPALYRCWHRTALLLLDPAVSVLAKETALLHAWVQAVRAGGAVARPVRSGADHRVARVFDYLQAHAADNVSLAALAELAGLSRYHLIRRFKARYGLTPHACLTDLRIRQARHLLRDPALPLAQVALAVGFADQSHFQRAFKARMATTPQRYRGQGLVSAPA
ncbi:AraC family transcriptional regulator [Chitiniphilus purpureus]|uniref:AraC family transcriptional regulator n=1 Tax=Chitiniphilus purpureus TaxID=2981137 RepID=A0ABY6DIM5_9NEIS|nr:AraC family transcriptional regulator [Chitiniphilus sp. CD1]UXY14191.1 AraC family transcriptional regulator [Chitiniphilus sp. CD1]